MPKKAKIKPRIQRKCPRTQESQSADAGCTQEGPAGEMVRTPKPMASEPRNVLMLQAKDRGIKNFRVLNKVELEQVLAEGVTPERIQEVVLGAVARWKAGWGRKKSKKAKAG